MARKKKTSPRSAGGAAKESPPPRPAPECVETSPAEELLQQHEIVQNLAASDQHEEALALAARLVDCSPSAPLLRCLARQQWECCDGEAAVETARRAVEREPGDVLAAADLVRFLACLGRDADAEREAQRIRSLPCLHPWEWTAKAEALDHVDDHAGVVELFEQADAQGLQHVERAGMLCLVAAASAFLLGQEPRARRLFRQAAQRSADLAARARENQADLATPSHERYAPWVHSLGEWLPAVAARELRARMQETSGTCESELDEAMREVGRRHPMLRAMVPRLLRRGDHSARSLALALLSDDPPDRATLRDLALGQDLPDSVRWVAARQAIRVGALAPDPVRMWLKGEWRTVVVLAFEIDCSIICLHDDPVMREGQDQALRMVGERRLAEAEAAFRKLLELEPAAPDFKHNLACVLGMMERQEEAVALMEEVHASHPTYVLSAVSLAEVALERGEVERARALLDPMLRLPRVHGAEALALCRAQQGVYEALGRPEDAHLWAEVESRFELDGVDGEFFAEE